LPGDAGLHGASSLLGCKPSNSTLIRFTARREDST
jgi:hypothetical protein